MTKMQDKAETYLTRDEYQGPTLRVDNISTFPKKEQDPNYWYKPVVVNYTGTLANNYYDHLERGWEVVYSTHHVRDDRAFTPDNNKEAPLRAAPVKKITRDGFEQVYMRISKVRYQANMKEDFNKRQEERLLAIGNKAAIKRDAEGRISEIDITDDESVVNLKQHSGDSK